MKKLICIIGTLVVLFSFSTSQVYDCNEKDSNLQIENEMHPPEIPPC